MTMSTRLWWRPEGEGRHRRSSHPARQPAAIHRIPNDRQNLTETGSEAECFVFIAFLNLFVSSGFSRCFVLLVCSEAEHPMVNYIDLKNMRAIKSI